LGCVGSNGMSKAPQDGESQELDGGEDEFQAVWPLLKIGMTSEEVLLLLGERSGGVAEGRRFMYFYPGGRSVTFDIDTGMVLYWAPDGVQRLQR